LSMFSPPKEKISIKVGCETHLGVRAKNNKAPSKDK
jgi:hypothetical protein